MGHIDKGERMDKLLNRALGMEVDKETTFSPLDLTILTRFIILSSCGVRMTHRQFRPALIQNMIQQVGSLPFRLKNKFLSLS
jgi:hypothetical protein